MKIKEIKELLNTEPVTCCDKLDVEIKYAFASDLMSDVLALANNDVMLITGLTNIQTIRTAEMKDIKCIIFVRGKVPDESVIELARQNDMIILCTKLTMFNTCGLLHLSGLQGADINK
ncbi:MAG: DRTGG domain-containing protein [Solirubrobacterales bacterium]